MRVGRTGSSLPAAAAGADLAWEDLQATSSQPIGAYEVYRSDGTPRAVDTASACP